MQGLRARVCPAYHFSRPILIACILTMPLTGCSWLSHGDQWPQWRGPNRDGVSHEVGWSSDWPADGPRVLWKAELGTGFSAPSIRDGRVYCLGNRDGMDIVYCLDARTGGEIWRYKYPCATYDMQHEGGPSATPYVDCGAVYTLSKAGEVHAINARTGRHIGSRSFTPEIGKLNVDYGCCASPLVVGDRLIINVGRVHVLDKTTMEIIWSSKELGEAFSSPMVVRRGGEDILVCLNLKGLFLFRLSDGKQLGHHLSERHKSICGATPIILGDKLFLTCTGGSEIYGIGAGNELKLLSDSSTFGNTFSTPVLWRGHLYGFNQVANQLQCIDPESREARWSVDGLGNGTLTIAGGKLIIMSESSELIVAEATPEGFEALAQMQVLGGKCWTTPVLVNKRIYCRNSNGELACVDVSDQAAR